MNFSEHTLPLINTFSKNYLSGAKHINFYSFTSILFVTLSKEEFVPSPPPTPAPLTESFFLGKYHNHCAIILIMNHYIFCLPGPINFVSILCKTDNLQLKKLSMTHIEIASLDKVLKNYSVHFIAEIVNSY